VVYSRPVGERSADAAESTGCPAGAESNIDLTGASLANDPDNPRPSPSRAEVDAAHRRFDPGLRRLFAARGAGAHEADELSQRTWAAVWQAVREGKYDPSRSALSTFVYAVAMKMWLRGRRSAARPPDAVLDLADRLLDRGADVGDAAALAELLGRVREALAGDLVSEDDRRVLLALSRGLSDRDLARELGVAPSTAHARKASALDRLRRALFADRPERRRRIGEQRGTGDAT